MAANNTDDAAMTAKKLKPSTKKSTSLEDSLSSITSKSKKTKSSISDGSVSSISSKSKKKKDKSADNGDSFASLNSRYYGDDNNDSITDQFMTSHQCLSSPSDVRMNSSRHKKIGMEERQQIKAPVSPRRPIPPKQHRVAIPESTTATTKKKKGSKPTVDLNKSCPSLFLQNESRRNNQSKKVAIPNPNDPTKVKTTFLEDCSDSSDSEHEKERKRIRKEKKKKEREKEIKAQKVASAAVKEPAFRRRSSIGPTVVPVLVPMNADLPMAQRQNSIRSDSIYCKYHHRAATKIAAMVRGHIGRMQYQIRQLQHRIDTMSRRTDDEIAEIYVELEISKQEWEEKAHERFQKNVKRGDKTLNVHEAQDLINKIRNENTDFRERNAQLLSDVEKLKINNERLEQANKESNDFTSRLFYHQEVVEVEHAKLVKVHSQYEESVQKHQDHLNLHIAHGECETKARNMYGRVLGLILDKMDTYKDRDQQLVSNIYEMVEALESEYGVIERQLVDTTNVDGKKDKKTKKTKKKSS
jgi:uncharacterized protein YukE